MNKLMTQMSSMSHPHPFIYVGLQSKLDSVCVVKGQYAGQEFWACPIPSLQFLKVGPFLLVWRMSLQRKYQDREGSIALWGGSLHAGPIQDL